jgi:hypothetical protein
MALSIGLNYPGESFSLNGCWNDVDTVCSLLNNTWVFNSSDISIMMDDPNYRPKSSPRPTKLNITTALKSFPFAKALSVLHYSGHGSQQRDMNRDETDGMDECICPSDCATQGMILDDDLHKFWASRVPANRIGLALMDCCHSGSSLDLPHLYEVSPSGLLSCTSESTKRDCAGIVISMSGCSDSQTSADAWDEHRRRAAGAFTTALSEVTGNGETLMSTPILTILLKLVVYMKAHGYSQRPRVGCNITLKETDTLNSLIGYL